MPRWLILVLGVPVGLWALYVLGVPLFERIAPAAWVRAYQLFSNPFFEPWMGIMWGFAVIETTGRKSGQPRRTPIGGRLRGNTYWLVAAERGRSYYVKNIEANPRVRLRIHGRWRTGTATVLTEDSPRRRLWSLNPVNSLFVWIAGHDPVTIRVDLDPKRVSLI